MVKCWHKDCTVGENSKVGRVALVRNGTKEVNGDAQAVAVVVVLVFVMYISGKGIRCCEKALVVASLMAQRLARNSTCCGVGVVWWPVPWSFNAWKISISEGW